MKESYTLQDFNTENWWFRPPHKGEDGIDFDSLRAIHSERGDMVFDSLCARNCFWYAAHLNGFTFEIFIYEVAEWSPGREAPHQAYPAIWVYGTTYDGVRETHGCPGSTADLEGFSAVLLEVSGFIKTQGWSRTDE